ncbi:GGDEF domain-containing protein [Sulfurimonas sp. HSL-1656]|uniref:GGDEF domain-containing protein n=1 Tax=Thiomicrolovo subterrani TaxID=3131934 RepID=UPI0031FA4003
MQHKSATKAFELQAIESMDFRRPVLVGLMLFMLLMLTWHTVAEARFGLGLMVFLEGGFAVYTAILLYFVWRSDYSRWLAVAFVIPAVGIILTAMFHPDTPNNVFVWTFIFPILTYALLGLRLGFAVTLAGSAMALAAYLSKAGDLSQGHNILILTDVVICMSIIWVIAHMYELYRQRSVEALQLMATTDELTGLQNRRQMEPAFAHLSKIADRQAQVLAVIVVDLDHFKQINDRWGHDAGDAVLKHAADLLLKNVRKSDWAFRTGGEEFCLLLQVNDVAGAVTVAETIRAAVEAAPCHYELKEIELSASIGVAVYPDEGRNFEQLLQRADAYMYHAKQAGRNRVVAADSERA